MTYTVRFDNISKKYRLGQSRKSLPSLFSSWVRKPFVNSRNLPEDRKAIWALRDVSFELSSGQSLALIGPNGAGKTTILKLLAKITRPTSGQIDINGRLSALIELGTGFHPDLTGRENIFLNGTILGLRQDEIRKRYDEIVAFSELERFLETPLKRYSSGMVVRLGFSVAAAIEPEILLIDEVLAVGDAGFRQKCLERIKSLTESGTTIVLVSHSMWLVQAVCETGLYIDHGQLKFRGNTNDVVDRYDRDLNEKRAKFFKEELSSDAMENAGIEITSIDILNPDSENNGELRHDQSARIDVHYLAYQDLGDLNAVVRIIRTDGATCCMMRTSLDNFPLTINRGSGAFSVTLDPIQLTGGSYYAQVIFRDAADAFGVASALSNWFYVSGEDETFTHSTMNGIFKPNRTWNHSKHEPNYA